MGTGNVGNLLRPEDLTSEELRDRARKGGKASVEARKKKKALKECAELLLGLDIQSKNTRKVLASLRSRARLYG